MKKIFMAILFVFASVCLSAQITNIYNPDSSLIVHQLYAGTIGATNFSQDSLSAVSWVGFRGAVNATYTINKSLSIHGIFSLDNTSDGNKGIQFFVLKTRLGKSIEWSNGFGAQIATLFHRPTPSSFAGHFEPWTKAKIPGAAPMTRISIGTENKVLASVAYRNNLVESHLGFDIKNKFFVSGWYADVCQWGGAVTMNLKKISITSFIDQEKFGYFTWLTLPEKWGWYIDLGISTSSSPEILRGETGILKSYSIPKWKLGGVIGGGYSYEQRAVRGYLTLSLSD